MQKDPRAELERWGFGIAPPKPHIWQRYNSAVRRVASLLQHQTSDDKETLLASLSEVKGLFNRVRRKDQWDWFIVWQRFGLPPMAQLRHITDGIQDLRDAVRDDDDVRARSSVSYLERQGAQTLVRRFLGQEVEIYSEGVAVLFVLSTKDSLDVLIVGTAKESDVVTVADQISERLGARVPFGVIHAWHVKDARLAKDKVFAELSSNGFTSPLDKVLADTRVVHRDYRQVLPIVDAALKMQVLESWSRT